ncbi:MAG: hypothetical protein QF864_03735 [SAR202 cluster bacterium]|nr:hypothetical protein [SAR202 cluster bacterium]
MNITTDKINQNIKSNRTTAISQDNYDFYIISLSWHSIGVVRSKTEKTYG